MRFETEDRFDAPASAVAEVLLDPAFQEALTGVSKHLRSRDVIAQRDLGDGKVERDIRCVVEVDVPALQRFIGNAQPSWVEHSTWDPQAKRWTWVMKPEVGGALMSADASIEILDDEPGCTRRVSGEVKVKVPFYGRRVEEVVIENLIDAYRDEADLIRQWLSPR